MASAAQIASAGTYITPDVGVEVTDGSHVRVQVGQFTAGSYGLKVISSDGTTVIIDGTSDMFKIAATGTLSQAFPAVGNSSKASVTLTSLGTFTTAPACLANTTDNNATEANARMGNYWASINLATGVVGWYANTAIALSASQAVVSLAAGSPTVNPSTTAGCRYWVMVEVGL